MRAFLYRAVAAAALAPGAFAGGLRQAPPLHASGVPPVAGLPAAAASLGAPAASGSPVASASEQAMNAAGAASGETAGPALDRSFDNAFRRTIDGPVDFPETELVRRNHGVGLYEGQDLRLRPWVPVSARATLGVDGAGRAFQVLDLGDRTVGYLLSGDQKMRALFLTNAGALVAVDRAGGLHQFSQARWERSGLRRILLLSALRLGGYVAAAASAIAAYQWAATGDALVWAPEAAAAFGLACVGAALLEAFWAGVRYEAQNAATDGFEALDAGVSEVRAFEAVHGDMTLRTARGERSLRAALTAGGWDPSRRVDFDVQPKHRFLPRGVHPKAWEP